MSSITINRIASYSNKMRQIKLFLNEQEIGAVKDGEIKTIPIDPGRHTLRAKIDWCLSNEIEFDIKKGETKTWNLKSPNPLFALYHITFGRNKYLKLEPSE